MDKNIKISLDYDDEELLESLVETKVEERIELCKVEQYTKFQKELLQFPDEVLNICCKLVLHLQESKIKNKKSIFYLAKFGESEFLNLLNSGDIDKINKSIDKLNCYDVQMGLYSELVDLLMKLEKVFGD